LQFSKNNLLNLVDPIIVFLENLFFESIPNKVYLAPINIDFAFEPLLGIPAIEKKQKYSLTFQVAVVVRGSGHNRKVPSHLVLVPLKLIVSVLFLVV
jgi:hypothetical protein